jgi:Lon protease-like protein
MSSFEDLSFSFADFSGRVRLFPLPNLVLFPHVIQPLRVFEPRYRRLLEDALAGDHLMAMAVLAPGWEQDYEGRPALYPAACLARVTTYHRLDDGAYNLLVLGLRRVRLARELEPERLYREAEAELCEDLYPVEEAGSQGVLARRLRKALLRFLPSLPEAREQMDQLLANDLRLGVLTDVVSYMLDADIAAKQRLLGEVNVYRRAEMLLAHLEAAQGGAQDPVFPPRFSVN